MKTNMGILNLMTIKCTIRTDTINLVGGVALYVQKELKAQKVDCMTMEIDHVFECVTVEIVSDKMKKMLISCIYKANSGCRHGSVY